MNYNIITSNNHLDILDEIATKIKANLIARKQIIIVPDKLQQTTQTAIFNKLNIQATFNLEVLSLSTLAGKIVVSNLPTLSNAESVMLIDMLLSANHKELKMFQKTTMSIPFASVMYNTINTLQNCLITPQSLFEFALSQNDIALKNKFLDISLIYKNYLDYTKDNFFDKTQKMQKLPEFVQKNEIITYSDIYFYGFDTFSPLEYKILSSIIPVANCTTVGTLVALPNQSNAHIYSRTYLENLIQIAESQNIPYTITNATQNLPEWQKHIASSVLGYAYQPLNVNKSPVNIYEASSPFAEIDFVAKDILRKIRTQHLRFKDISILSTNLPLYAPIITNIFSNYNIPCHIDSALKLTETIDYQLISAVFNIILTNFDSSSVLSFIKNPILNIPKNIQNLIENTINKFGLNNQNITQFIPELNTDNDYLKYFEEITKILVPVQNLIKNFSFSTKINDFCQFFNEFLNEINYFNNIKTLSRNAFMQSDLVKHGILKQTPVKIQKIFDQMLNIIPDFCTNFTEFVAIFNHTASSTTISPLPMPIDCVKISSTVSGVIQTCDSTYILCATEGSMPSFALDVGLITDNDIQKLANSHIYLSPSVNQINLTNKLKLIQQLLYAKQDLTLTYPMYNGNEKFFPSTLTNDLTNAFNWQNNPLPIINIDAMLNNDLAFGSTIDRLLFTWGNRQNMLNALSLSQNTAFALPPNIASTVYQYLLNNGLDAILHAISSDKMLPFLDKNTAYKLFFPKNRSKVTEIERYFNCPYQHFLEYGLKLRTPEVSQIDSLTIGTILHAVLENFTKMMINSTLPSADISNIATTIFDQIILAPQYAYLRVSGQNQTILNSLRAESVRICMAIYYQQSHSKYQIKFIEASFGDDNFVPVPQIAVLDTTTKLAMRGKIDRIDNFGKRYRIIDYKTSKHSGSFNLLDFYLGKKIQLFYYAACLLQGLRESDPDASIGGVFYIPLHREYSTEKNNANFQSFKMDGVVVASPDNLFAQDDTVCFDKPQSTILPFAISTSKANVAENKIVIQDNKANVTTEEMQLLLDYSMALVTKAISELVEGFILPKPITKACEFCNYKSVCKIKCNSNPSLRSDEYKIDTEDFGGIKW